VDVLLHKITKYISDNNLLMAGDTVIVAVSGGADSVALLDILANLKELELRLIVAHVNHLLRGDESAADADFVRELAGKYQLPFELQAVDVRELSVKGKLSLEMGGRLARYAFFDEAATKFNAKAIALAHHADDQAETVLMRLLRGAGTTGLAGIPNKSADRYVRPLLTCRRNEIEAYLARKKLCYRTDSTNVELEFLRNRIRHELLPYLKTFNPRINDRLVATAEILAADETLLEEITGKSFRRLAKVTGDEVILDLAATQAEIRGQRFRLYRSAIQSIRGTLTHVSFKNLVDVDSLLFSCTPNAALDLPRGIKVTKSYHHITFAVTGEVLHDVIDELHIEGTGVFPLPHGKALSVTMASPPENWKTVPATSAYFDLEQVCFPWLVRTFKPGDRITPFGMTGSKKVKDLFIDMKIPLKTRQVAPVIISNEKIIWICGVKVAATSRISADTRTVVRVDILELSP
jgi:tRNA(Ile)-lysidine synthase